MVREPVVEDLKDVLEDIRPADMAEWYAGTGKLFQDSAFDAVQSSEIRRVALDDTGRALCFWGGDGGSLWMFATVTAAKRAISLHRLLRPSLVELHERWERLVAHADSRNTVHHQWLVWLGFKLEVERPAGPFGLPFKTFVKEAPSCV